MVAYMPAAADSTGYAERSGEPEYINFKVIDITAVDNEMCYIIEVTYDNPINEDERKAVLQLYIRKGDFTLKKALEITRDSVTQAQRTDDFHNNGHEFIIFRNPFKIPILCDFPNFPAVNTDEERTLQASGDSCPETQKVIFLDQNTLKIELSTPYRNGILRITQIWEKGRPWWSSVSRTLTYNDTTKPGHPEITRIENEDVLIGKDTAPPHLTVRVDPDILWPPDLRMVKVTPSITVSDDYDRYPDVRLELITCNEPGRHTKWLYVIKDGQIFLRSERYDRGRGRIYTITYTATDASGNKAAACAIVTVPLEIRIKKRYL